MPLRWSPEGLAAVQKDRKPIRPAEPRAMADPLFLIGPGSALLGLAAAGLYFRQLGKPQSTSHEHSSANDPLGNKLQQVVHHQNQTGLGLLGCIFVALLMMHFAGLVPASIAPAFLIGGLLSGLTSKLATSLFQRTREEASPQSVTRCGSVIGLIAASLALLYVSASYAVMTSLFRTLSLAETTTLLVSFALGTSAQAVLAYGGGEILQLNNRSESEGMPYARPTTSAARLAGTAADLHDTVVSTNFAVIALAFAALASLAPTDTVAQARVSTLPLTLSGSGMLLSLLIAALTKDDPKNSEGSVQRRSSLLRLEIACLVFSIASAALCYITFRGLALPNQFGWTGLWGSVFLGTSLVLLTTVLPRSQKSEHTWLASRLFHCCSQAWMVGCALLVSFWLAGGFSNHPLGLLGIGLTAIGFLAPLPLTVQLQTRGASSTQNFSTLAGTLCAISLVSAYGEVLRRQLIVAAEKQPSVLVWGKTEIDQVGARAATYADLATWYQATLLNPITFAGLLIGATVPLLLASFIVRSRANLRASEHSEFQATRDNEVQQLGHKAYREASKAAGAILLMSVFFGVILGPVAMLGLLLGCILSGGLFGFYLHSNELANELTGAALTVGTKLLVLGAVASAGLVVKWAPLLAARLGLP